eukprot:NODE_34_length_31639_cov_0.254375.p8 type:complete len:323 gc:universal NODE_34_length_31639_cov_0.254375:30497-31465(+)
MEKLIFIGGNDLNGVPKIVKQEQYCKSKIALKPIKKGIAVLPLVNPMKALDKSAAQLLYLSQSCFNVTTKVGLPTQIIFKLVNTNNSKYYLSFRLVKKVFVCISNIQSKKAIMPYEELDITVTCNSQYPGWFRDVYDLQCGDQVLKFQLSCFFQGSVFAVDKTKLIHKAAERNAHSAIDLIFKTLWSTVEYKQTVISPLLFYVPLRLHSKVAHLKVSTKDKFLMEIEKQLEPEDVEFYMEMINTFNQNDLFLPAGSLKVFDKALLSCFELDLQVCFSSCLDFFCEDLLLLKKQKKKDKKISIEEGLKIHILTFLDSISVFLK